MDTDSSARWALGGPLAVVSAGTLAFSAGSYFGEWWWMFDAIANFRVQLVVVGALGLVVGFFMRLASVATIAGAIIVVNLLGVIPLYVGPTYVGPSLFDQVVHLRVVSYNLYFGAIEESDEVIAWLEGLDADVVFLYEVGVHWRLRLEQADLPWKMVGPFLRPGEPFGTLALVPEDSDVSRLDILSRSSILVTTEVDGRPVSVLGVHLISPYNSAGARVGDAELVSLGEWAADQEGSLVVVGDLNATPFTWAFRRMTKISGLVDSEDGFGVQPTWPTSNAWMRVPIDHVLHTDDFVTVERQVLESFGSDHFLITAGLALRD